MLMPAPIHISLTDQEREEFMRRCRSGKTAARMKERLSIVLLAEEELTNEAIKNQLLFRIHKIARWSNRLAEFGSEGIEKDRPRGANHGGSNSVKQAKLREQVIECTQIKKKKLPEGASHRITRTLAAKLKTNHSFVRRVWNECGFKPQLISQFKICNDPLFKEKLEDVVGLYLNPPQNAVVFSVDEKIPFKRRTEHNRGCP